MPMPVSVGQVLAGKYRIEKILGAGGMGIVVGAFHLELETLVALKFLLPEAAGNPSCVERFVHEARAAVRLRSEHVCQVKDLGRLDGGSPFIVMEYLDGHDLHTELRQQGPLPISDVIEYVLQACEAMSEAHALGIVHRDLKPQNLFLTRRVDGSPLVKVLDFGIAKAVRGDCLSATQMTAVMGSPSFMAPEQARCAKDVDRRADVYSLGAILYQLVTGRLPYPALERPAAELSLTEALLAVQMDRAVPPRSYRPGLPVTLQPVIMRAIEKRREDRYQSVTELAAALLPFAPARLQQTLVQLSHVLPITQPPTIRQDLWAEVAETLSLAGPAFPAGLADTVLPRRAAPSPQDPGVAPGRATRRRPARSMIAALAAGSLLLGAKVPSSTVAASPPLAAASIAVERVAAVAPAPGKRSVVAVLPPWVPARAAQLASAPTMGAPPVARAAAPHARTPTPRRRKPDAAIPPAPPPVAAPVEIAWDGPAEDSPLLPPLGSVASSTTSAPVDEDEAGR